VVNPVIPAPDIEAILTSHELTHHKKYFEEKQRFIRFMGPQPMGSCSDSNPTPTYHPKTKYPTEPQFFGEQHIQGVKVQGMASCEYEDIPPDNTKVPFVYKLIG
jgi:hypothetical protein